MLWGGRLGPWDDKNAGYLSAADLEKAMYAWNDALLRVCEKRHLECFDLAARIPKTTEAFYDDSHSTDRGASMYADQLAKYLLAASPFNVRPERNLQGLSKRGLQQSRHLQTRANPQIRPKSEALPRAMM